MKAKIYLEQLEILDTKIQQKQIQLDYLKLKATGTGGISYGDRVQKSPSGDSICNTVTKWVALEQEINDDIDKFVDKQNVIINQIQLLNDARYIKLLFKRYVQFKRLKAIAVEMNYSYPYVKEIHDSALKEFERTYPILPQSVLY